MSNGNQTIEQAALAQQQAAGLGRLGAQAAREPTNIEHAINKCERILEQQHGTLELFAAFTDRVNGPEPHKETLREQDCPAGQLSQLHGLLDRINENQGAINQALERLNGTV